MKLPIQLAMLGAVALMTAAQAIPPRTGHAVGAPETTLLRTVGAVGAPAPAVVWSLDGEGRGTPAADESSAFFLSKRHEVIALHRRDGTVRWRQITGEPAETTEGFAVVLAGTVVAAGDYQVIAFDRLTGAFRWRFIPREGYGPGIYLGQASGGTILTGSPAGRLYAIDAERGTERWSTVVAADGRTTVFPPVVRGSVAAAGYSEFSAPHKGGLVLFDVETGVVRWKQAFPPSPDPTIGVNAAGGPVFWNEHVIVSNGDGIIRGFSVASGEALWSIPRVTTKPGDIITGERDWRALVAARGVLVAGSATGYIVAYDLATRRERWTAGGPALGSVMLRMTGDDSAVYVPTFSGELLALDLETGEELWRRGHFLEGFNWEPLVTGDLVLASASRAGFFAFPRVTRP